MWNERRPVIVISPPRSGSSLTGNLLMSAGIFGGDMKRADEWNARGYFENERITKILVEYLRDHDTQHLKKRFHPIDLRTPVSGFGDTVVDIIKSQGLNDGQRWFFKDPKTIYCWRLWAEHFPEAQWILVRRDRQQIIDSLMRTPFMDAYETAEQWNQYLNILEMITDELKPSVDHYEFDISAVFDGDASQIQELFEYLSRGYLKCTEKHIDRRLWNGAA